MKIAFAIITFAVFLATAENEHTIIAANPSGFIISLKERCGTVVTDTGTVATLFNGTIWVTHRDGPSSFYPIESYSIVSIVRKLY